jgi:hypothetical protein
MAYARLVAQAEIPMYHTRFGLALPDQQQVYVREDLQGCVKRFVISHELFHLRDKTQWWVRREVKAMTFQIDDKTFSK